MANSKLYLKIFTRRGIVFDQEVASVSSINEKGKFDVLREHAQFISIIKDHMMVVLLDGQSQKIAVENAVMRVKGDHVQVFLSV